MLDTSKLDITKTYVGSEIGSGDIAYGIQELCHKIYNHVPVNQIASHSLALRYKNNYWMVWENHLKWGGIHEYLLLDYLSQAKANKVKTLIINEYYLDQNSLNYWLINNPGYSVTNLALIAERRLLPVPIPLPDTKSWICSQSVVANNFKICIDLKLKFEEIAPVDIQVYLQNTNNIVVPIT
jgi:hypothetical protein